MNALLDRLPTQAGPLRLQGSIPALVTPFDASGRLDADAFIGHVGWQLAMGSHAVVVCGTTGEPATMSLDERAAVTRLCVEAVRGRVPVIAGVGAAGTEATVANAQRAADAGADAVLVVTPYYNRPNSTGLLRHFEVIAERTVLPVVLYNVPPRTLSDLTPDLVIRLVRMFPSVFIALKDGSGDPNRVTMHRAALGSGLAQLTANDEQALAFNALGGVGCISVTANVAPRLCVAFQEACARGDLAMARGIHDRLQPLHAALFSDASPGPVKYALTRIRAGFPPGLRLPMTWPSEASQRAVDAALERAGIGVLSS